MSHPLAAAVYNGFEAGLNTNYYAEPAQAPGSSSLFGGSVAVLNVASRYLSPACRSPRAQATDMPQQRDTGARPPAWP